MRTDGKVTAWASGTRRPRPRIGIGFRH